MNLWPLKEKCRYKKEGAGQTTGQTINAMSATTPHNFNDTSTECGICYDLLSTNNDTITLRCGHRWHLNCMLQQLKITQPDGTKRLLFSGCRCAKCNAFCEHPALEHLTRPTDVLREKVNALVVEQLQIDAPQAWKNATEEDSKLNLINEGLRTYAFYLCSACKEPYFGGTVHCADQVEGELSTSSDRLCSVCSPKAQLICQKPLEHRAFHVWKCRYCCNPATFVCYGNVHFCKSCHDRNSERDRRKRQGDRVDVLEAIPCTGESCFYPKLEGHGKHCNGSSLDCEQVYNCAYCISIFDFEEEKPGSRNLVFNPSGEDGIEGWTMVSPHPSGKWTVETIDLPVDGTTRANFVSSYSWCTMYQSIPLHRYVLNPSSVRIEVSSKFMRRTDCPSVFQMEVILKDSFGRTIKEVKTEKMDAPAGFWQKTSLIIDAVDGTHELIMILHGKDSKFWAGRYGSKVCHCSVRVLGHEEELKSIMK